LGVAIADGKIYAIGGENGEGVLNVTEAYDPATNEWTTRASTPTARSDFGIATYQDKIYIFGGTIGHGTGRGEALLTGATEVYDPETDTWETKTSIPTPRQSLEGNMVSDKIYLIGGVRYVGGFNIWGFHENEVYDPDTDSWTTEAPLPTAVWSYSSAVINDKIYLMGGGNWTTPGIFPTTLNQIYTPENDTWSFGQDIPTGLWGAAAGATTGVSYPKRIYVLGGIFPHVSDNHNLTQMYDPEANAWSTGTPIPTPRHGFGVAVIGDELYAVGGSDGITFLAVNEKYTPTDYIPEFPSWIILPLFLIIILFGIILRKKFRVL
jgi:N-acetylneuraminic acid mutarotase